MHFAFVIVCMVYRVGVAFSHVTYGTLTFGQQGLTYKTKVKRKVERPRRISLMLRMTVPHNIHTFFNH